MKYKWKIVYLLLALALLFSLVAVPRIAINSMDQTKGRVIVVEPE